MPDDKFTKKAPPLGILLRMTLPGSGMIRVKRRLNSTDVVDALTDLFVLRGPPAFLRSDYGAEFTTLREAHILIERWRHHYNTVRPHTASGSRPPAPKSIIPIDQRPTMH